jgi:hypothetical protein
MAENQIEIEVELTGAKKVEKSIQGIETGLEGIGETGSKLVQAMGSTNEQLGEGLENVAGSVGEVREAFTQLGTSVKNLGTSGMSGILGLIGPLGMLVGAGVMVYETFRQISGAAQEAEEAQEAMAAAAGDLQSRLESLAESGIILAKDEMVKFSVAVLEAQFLKERVQKQQEKFAKNFEGIRKQIEAVQKATEDLDFVQQYYSHNVEMLAEKTTALRDAQNQLNFERKLAEGQVNKLNKANTFYLKSIERVTEIEEKAREQSTENLKSEALRLANLIKQNDELRFQNELRKDQIQLNEMLTQINVDHIRLTKALEDANRKQVEEILKGLKARSQGIDEITVAERKAAQERDKIAREESKKRVEAYKKQVQDRAKIAEQERKKEIVLESRLRQLTIQQEQQGVAQQLALQAERLNAASQLTKEGTKERLIAEKQFQLAVDQIMQRDLDQRRKKEQEAQKIQLESQQRQIEQSAELTKKMLEFGDQSGIFGTDFEALQAEQNKRLAMLEIEYQKEIELAQLKNQDLMQIQQHFALERALIEKQSIQEQSDLIADYFNEYGQGFADAAVSALLFGDSIQDATADILKGLAKEAGVRSLMSFAEGFAQLALGDPRASSSFVAGAKFAAAATLAGVAGSSLATGGTAGGTAGGTTPTGTPTTAPTPQREQASTDSMVFNINFGGAVVYDTKKAAEQALADRLVSIMNTRRRGAPQLMRR